MAEAVTVKIKYVGPVADIERKGLEIARTFTPNNSYVDTPVFTEGYPNDDSSIGDGEAYGKSIYATNVCGVGGGPGLLPMNSTTVKFAYFEQAIMVAAEAKEKEEENTGVEFELAEGDYEDVLYWEQMCRNMAVRGFYCEVGDKKYGTDVEESTDGGTDGGDDSGN